MSRTRASAQRVVGRASACRRSACRGSAARRIEHEADRDEPRLGRPARSWPGPLVGRTRGTRAEPADRSGSDGIAAYHGLMPRSRWLFAGAVMAVAAVALLVATLGRGNPAGRDRRESRALRHRVAARRRDPDGIAGTPTPSVDPTADGDTCDCHSLDAHPPTAPPRASGPAVASPGPSSSRASTRTDRPSRA